MKNRVVIRPAVAALISVLALQGCATQNQKGERLTLGQSLKETFASDDPCANSKRNTGILIGVTACYFLAKANGQNEVLAASICGLIGGMIGAELDSRQCELSKIQQKYSLDMQVTPIAVGASDGANKDTEPKKVGFSVAVVNQAGKPQFLTGSSALQTDAKQHFSEIAKQYSPDQAALQAWAATGQEKNQASEKLRVKRILLIGHTDDTGSSKTNAELSERRAREVAQVFRAAGVGEEQLYFQGAGETLPIADNATEEGRAKNRRVEIVDLSNEETFKLYLQNRRPNTTFYRSADATVSALKATNVTKPTVAHQARKLERQASIAAVTSDAPLSRSKPVRGGIDFGGVSVTASNATVSLGELAKPKRGFLFISEAQASDMGAITRCDMDRPRNAGLVKSFKDGKAYATNEYLPGLYGRSWQDTVGGNLVMLNGVAVLRDGAAPANAPILRIYANYDPVKNRNPKADVEMNPAVNAYQGSNGLLYRVFTQGEHGLQCMDVLMDGSSTAKAGKVIYGSKGREFVSNFKPTMVN